MVGGAKDPLGLNAVVQLGGQRAVVIGRAKPVGAPWQYDLLVNGESSQTVVRAMRIDADWIEMPAAPVSLKNG